MNRTNHRGRTSTNHTFLRIGAILSLLSLVVLTGCAVDEGATSAQPDEPAIVQEGVAIETPEDLRRALRESGSGEEWFDALSEIVFTTKLRSAVVELHFKADAETTQSLAQAAFSALHAAQTDLDAWVEAWSEEGQVAGTGLGTPRQRDLPPAPTDIDELRTWLDEVYGPGSGEPTESWYQAIESIELGTSGGGEPAVVVRTTLLIDDPGTAGQTDLIALAISASGLTFAEDIDVWYADDAGMLSSGISGFDPYVY